MKLYYVLSRDVRKNRAVAVDTMKVCGEFAKNGFDVKLVTPRTYRLEYRKRKDEIWALYNLSTRFPIVELPTCLWDNMPTLLFQMQLFPAFLLYYLYLLLRGRIDSETILYSTAHVSYVPAVLLRKMGLLKCKLVFMKYDFNSEKKVHKFVAKSVDGIVVINEYLRGKVVTEYGVANTSVFKAGFPSLYEEMQALLGFTTEQARRNLGLSASDKIALYAGKMGPDSLEIRYILSAAKLLPDVKFVLIGVRDIFREYFESFKTQNGLHNVEFIGFQPLPRLQLYLRAATVLVSYYDSFDPLSPYQRVPAKAGIYFAANKPLVFADLPSLREWCDDSLVFFAQPDKPEILADKIHYIITHPAEAELKASRCLEFARKNTYTTAYREVSRFIKSVAAGERRPISVG